MSTCFEGSRRQRGDVLLEALFGVLITAIFGAGMAHVAARISRSQHEAGVDALLVNQMRNQLQMQGLGLCGRTLAADELDSLPAALRDQGVTLQADACSGSAPLSVTIGSSVVDVPQPAIVHLRVSGELESGLVVSSHVPRNTGPGGAP